LAHRTSEVGEGGRPVEAGTATHVCGAGKVRRGYR